MTSDFIREVAYYLAQNGIGTVGTDIFVGNLPDGEDFADAIIGVFETPGLPPDIEIPLYAPGFQVLIRDTRLDYGLTKTQSIRDLLHNFYNGYFKPSGTYVYACNLNAQGGHIGEDDKGRDLFSLNFTCKVR